VARHPDASKQDRWLQLMRLWRRSHISVREFCQRHQVSEARFFSWRRVLRERGLLDGAISGKPSVGAPAFVKLTALDAERIVSPVELVLNRGRVLRLRPGFDADMLLELVRLLEEPAC
jgi:transposase-like protein